MGVEVVSPSTGQTGRGRGGLVLSELLAWSCSVEVFLPGLRLGVWFLLQLQYQHGAGYT